jgi:ankyrin repeat protein
MDTSTNQETIERFVAAALPPMKAHRSGSLVEARALVEDHPALATADLRCALLTGNASVIGALLKSDPTLVYQKLPPHDWEPLLFVCFSVFYRDDRSRRSEFHETAKVLLEHGADAATYFMLGDEKETALYGATGVANDSVLGAMLLDAGADVNDDDASYHIAEHETCEAIELFVRRGMKPDLLATTLLHKLDCDDLGGLKTILDLGIDPNGKGHWGKSPLHQAIMRGRGDAFVELLIDRGADVNAVTGDGRSVYAMAARTGRTETMELLARHGAETALRPVDQWLAACGAVDEAAAAALVADHPDLVAAMSDEDRVAMVEAARDGKTAAVRLMLDCRIDPATRGACGGTALHWAAWHGRAETVQMLLANGAPLDLLCTSYRTSPLGWCVYGSTACNDPSGDYVGTVEAFLDAGAAIEPTMLQEGTPEIVARLESFAGK